MMMMMMIAHAMLYGPNIVPELFEKAQAKPYTFLEHR
jgi:hypothetical protein